MQIQGYHIHFYCTPEYIPLCNSVRSKLIAEVKGLGGAGPVRSLPIGPHPLPMFEAWFGGELLSEIVEWTLRNREGLPVLIHPITGNDLDDHALHGIWIGEKLNLKLEIFR